MKKILIATNLFWISIISFQACDTLKQISKDNLPTAATLSCPGCTDYDKNTNSQNPNAYGSTAGLSLGTARLMSNNYQVNCQPRLGGNPGSGVDARSAWFSLGTLKQFIFNIEKASCSNNCFDSLELGVRIYYAQYPDFTSSSFLSGANASAHPNNITVYNDLHTVNSNYGKNHTLFMVPTYDQAINGNLSNIAHIDFDPWNMGSTCKPTSLTALPNDTKAMILSPDQPQYGRQILKRKMGSTQRFSDNSLLQNHGNLYPPDNSTGTAF